MVDTKDIIANFKIHLKVRIILCLNEMFFDNFFLTIVLNLYGTGSKPLPPQGWQREILLIPSHPPLNNPYFFRASKV